jgi:hypothetical protein
MSGRGGRTRQETKQEVQPREQKELIDLSQWVAQLYNVADLQEENLKAYYEAFKFKGFDRNRTLQQLQSQLGDRDLVIQASLVCALRGPSAAAKIKLLNGRSLQEMGISASGKKGTEDLSCSRITAATADLAAYLLKKLDAPKRLSSQPCPSWLQFPSAGAIKLPADLRTQHIEFSKAFSVVIGGSFNEAIYGQMELNSYYNEGLGLFN